MTMLLITVIDGLVEVYTFLIVVHVLMSWIPYKRGIIGDIDHVLGLVCDPYLNIFRRFIPPIGGVIDISPIVAILALQLIVGLVFLFI